MTEISAISIADSRRSRESVRKLTEELDNLHSSQQFLNQSSTFVGPNHRTLSESKHLLHGDTLRRTIEKRINLGVSQKSRSKGRECGNVHHEEEETDTDETGRTDLNEENDHDDNDLNRCGPATSCERGLTKNTRIKGRVRKTYLMWKNPAQKSILETSVPI